MLKTDNFPTPLQYSLKQFVLRTQMFETLPWAKNDMWQNLQWLGLILKPWQLFRLTVDKYLMYEPSIVENTLKSARQVAAGSNPWEHVDDDLHLMRLGLYRASQHGLIFVIIQPIFSMHLIIIILFLPIIFISQWSLLVHSNNVYSGVHLSYNLVQFVFWHTWDNCDNFRSCDNSWKRQPSYSTK